MKTLLKSLAVLTVLAFSFAPISVRAQDDSGGGDDDQGVSFQTFYDQLGDQGTWVQTDDYGYVFQPNVSDPDWQPYTDGGWVDSDAGYTWVSDEPWGWATYHYGRWVNIDGTGWVWVPGYRWAPAWVSWRYGGGYCGWAPLPPETLYGAEYGEPGVQVGFGFHFGGDVDVNFNIGPGYYNFIRVEDMGERNYRHHFVDRSQNFVIINHTNNITNINVTNGRNNGGFRQFHGITSGGPPINEINAHARQHIQTVQFTASNQPGRSTLQGNTLAVFAPRVNPNSLHEARPGTVTQTINHPTFNRGDSISKPLDVTRNIHATPPTPEAIHAAEQAQATIPATAKIATPRTQMRTAPNQPFTSLTPVVHNNSHTPGTQGFNNGNPNHTGNPSGSVNTPGNQPNEIKSPTFNQQQQQNPAFNQAERPHAESVNPTLTEPPANNTFHPQTQVQTENQGNPNVIHNNTPQTFHPQNQENPNIIHNDNNPPSHTFHSENQNNNGGNQHPSFTPPPQTFHSESQNNGGNQPPTHLAPTQTAPPTHMESPSNNGSFHPQNQSSGGNGGGQPHPSSGGGQGQQGGQGGNHASGGGQGGNHPSNGDGKDKKPQGQ